MMLHHMQLPSVIRHEPGYATVASFYDTRGREFRMLHFTGHDECSLSPNDTRLRPLLIDRSLAMSFAFYFDHFARCGALPVQFPEPDYMI